MTYHIGFTSGLKWAFLFIFLAGLVIGCSREQDADRVTAKVEALRSAYAPDKRVSIFNLKVDTHSKPVRITGETQYPEALAELRNFMDTSGIAYVDSVRILPEPQLEGVHFGVVRVPVANMRSAHRHQAEMATQAVLGTPIRVWKKEGDWYYVQTPDQYLGWMSADGFTPMKVDQFKSWMEREKVMVTGRFSDVFAGDTARGPIITSVFQGQILSSAGDPQGGFCQVQLPDGRHGYLHEYHVQEIEEWLEAGPPDPQALIETAMSFLGTSYLWGGTSPYGFDCSGFTKTVFYLNGLLLPRDASQQVHTGVDLGTGINPGNWRPADLLFFGKPASEDVPEKITHVAIYLGEGKFIHASGNVKIESLNRADPDFAAQRYETFVRARRMIGVPQANRLTSLSALAEYGGK